MYVYVGQYLWDIFCSAQNTFFQNQTPKIICGTLKGTYFFFRNSSNIQHKVSVPRIAKKDKNLLGHTQLRGGDGGGDGAHGDGVRLGHLHLLLHSGQPGVHHTGGESQVWSVFRVILLLLTFMLFLLLIFFFTCTFVCVCVLLFFIYIFLRFVTFQNAFDFPFFTFEMYLAFLLLCHVNATFSASPSMSALVPTYLSVIHKPLRQQVSRSHHFGQSGSHISQYSARVLFSTKNFNQDPAALVEGVERWPESDACFIYDKLNINITKLLDSNYWSTCFFMQTGFTMYCSFII